jgi:hypothetical protein
MKKQKWFKNRQFLCDSGGMLEKDRSLTMVLTSYVKSRVAEGRILATLYQRASVGSTERPSAPLQFVTK